MSSLGAPQKGQSGKSGTRQLRNRLALTTILTVAPFFGYGRAAYAACDPAPASPTFVCTGANVVTQAITANNANVSTAPGFSVIAPAGNGITVTGDGHLRFTDQNASIITGDEDGLSVSATGNAGATPGAVTVTVNSTITGGFSGLRANNNGAGDLVVTADGKVTGQNGSGILAGVGANGRNLTVNTGAQSDITGYRFGIDARSSGTGDLFVNANGKVTAIDGDGMHAFTTGRDLAITTGVDSVITGSRFGMIGRNDGTGDLAITVNGDVTGTEREGVYALGNSTANNVTVTIAAGSTVKGGYDGVEARNIGRGALNVKVYGDVTGTVQNGIWVVNYAGTSATVLTGAQSKVTGYDGIGGRNDSGDFTITANGEVTGTDRHGIYARNTANGGKLKITAGATSDVTGYSDGIRARNDGSGELEIIVEGKVDGKNRYGIEADNSSNGDNLVVTTTAGSEVTGFLHGIRGKNYGSGGDLVITADGEVTGKNADGISAQNRSPAVNLTIMTGSASVISGYSNGIDANNSGSGDISITANGAVYGNGAVSRGITAFNSSNSKTLEIITGAASVITGGADGIGATNSGTENLEIDVSGRVTGTNGYGIKAANSVNGADLTITTAAGSDVEGRNEAIIARNSGRGTLAVTVDGMATGTIGNAIMAVNYAAGEELTIRTGATSSLKGFNGIAAQNSGRGDLTIDIAGDVTGTNFDGIYGRNFANAAKLTITTAAGSVVSGNDDGIDARMDGTGDIEIVANGLVAGQNGIRAYNNTGGAFAITVGATGAVEGIAVGIKTISTNQPVVISNAGLITATNLMAIDAKGNSAEITNSGVIRGRVDLTGGDDRLDNLAGGVFAARSSDFGAGNDVVNNAGLVQAAHGIAEFENVYFDKLEVFNNSGTVSLVDGLANDQFGMGPAASFVSYGGRLAVDAFLAPGSDGKSDKLLISGSSSGTTTLVVNLTNPIGSAPNSDGIRVVVVDGTSLAEDFRVEGGVLNAGFFAWDLRRVQDGISVEHQLYTTGLGAGAYEFAAGITGAQDMWQQTTGTLLQRQADLRPLIGGTQVTPVADFADPVAPTPVGRVTPGLWFKAVGGWLNRDADADNNVVLDRKQTVFGGIAGFDFGTENVSGQGDALLFGLFGGYLTSKLSFDSTNTEWTYDGPTVGAYATYLNDAFYADLVIKADFLDIDIDAGDLAPDAEADTDATNIGGQIDLGYKIGLGQGAFIEPQASLSLLHTEIDDIDDIFGGSVAFEDETSARGRLGLRLGADYEHDGLLLTPDVTASVWQSFSGDNNVTVLAPLTPASNVSDDPGETMGDVSVGLAVTAPDGWTGFLRGNYQFAEDFEAVTGNAGLRYAW
jgi:outer membrane autotransporter protein